MDKKKYKNKVSLIITSYNQEEKIKRCIDSILNDKLKEKEIIIINDGSTDKTLDILKTYENKYKNIKIINQKNKGQALARNIGLKESTGEYISFIDSDDFVEKNYIYNLYKSAIDNNSDYVYCDYYEYSNNKNKYISSTYTDNPKKVKIIENFAPWGKLISHELINNIDFKFPDLKMCEDIAVIPILAVNSKNAYHIKEGLYYYNLDSNSLTRIKEYDDKLLEIMKIPDILYNYFKDNNLLEEYRDELKYTFVQNILKYGVLNLAKHKESLKYIKELRKCIKSKFSNLLSCKYYKYDALYSKVLIFISIYFPPKVLYILNKIKNR